MHFLVKKAFSQEQFHNARKNIIENKEILNQYLHTGVEFKKNTAFKIPHHEFVKLNNLTETIISEKIINFFKKKFKKIFLINHFVGTINAFEHRLHRDGQGLGYTKKGLEMSEKIFKVVCYFNDYESKIINISAIPSKPLKFFNDEKKFIKFNYFYDHYIKKFFLKDSGYKNCDALIFDNNTWHGTTPKNLFKEFNENEIRKIYVSYEIVVDDINIAKEYGVFQSEKYKIKTNYLNELKYLVDSRLNLFDKIIDLGEG